MNKYINDEELTSLTFDLTNLDLSKCSRVRRALFLLCLTILIMQINSLDNELISKLEKSKNNGK